MQKSDSSDAVALIDVELLSDIFVRSTGRGHRFVYLGMGEEECFQNYIFTGNTLETEYKFSQPTIAYGVFNIKDWDVAREEWNKLLAPVRRPHAGILFIQSLLSLYKSCKKDKDWTRYLKEDPITGEIYRTDREKDASIFVPIQDFLVVSTIRKHLIYLSTWYKNASERKDRPDILYGPILPLIDKERRSGYMTSEKFKVGFENFPDDAYYNLLYVRGTNYIEHTTLQKQSPGVLPTAVLWFHDKQEGDYASWYSSDKIDMFVAKANMQIYPLVRNFLKKEMEKKRDT